MSVRQFVNSVVWGCMLVFIPWMLLMLIVWAIAELVR